MDFLSLAAVAAPLLALGLVIAEIIMTKPSALAELLQDSESFARASLAATSVTRCELVPANDQTKLAA